MDNSRSGRPVAGASEAGASLTEEAQATAEELKASGRRKLEEGKSAAADKAATIASAIDAAADRLGESEALGTYAHAASRSISQLAEKARSRSLDELFAEAQALAQRNPGLFALGSVGAGIVLARFLKASARRQEQSEQDNLARSAAPPPRPHPHALQPQADT